MTLETETQYLLYYGYLNTVHWVAKFYAMTRLSCLFHWSFNLCATVQMNSLSHHPSSCLKSPDILSCFMFEAGFLVLLEIFSFPWSFHLSLFQGMKKCTPSMCAIVFPPASYPIHILKFTSFGYSHLEGLSPSWSILVQCIILYIFSCISLFKICILNSFSFVKCGLFLF